jgi:WD40 repeat protein
VLSLAVSPDGAWLAASFDDDDPAVSHLHSRGQDYFLGGHLGEVSSLCFSPDSRYFITLCDDGKARVFDLARPGLYVPRPSPPESALSDFHCASPMTEGAPPPPFPSHSPDGKWELSVERSGLLRWRRSSGPWRSLPATGGPLSALRFTPDSRYLVTVAADGQTRLWRLDDGAGVGLPGHRGALGGLDVHRDGRRLVLGGPDGKLRLYTLTGDGSPLAASLTEILEGHRAGITLAAFAPQGETLLSMSQDGSTRLWREAGRCEILIEGEEDSGELEEFGVALRRDFRQLITQRRDGLRLLWELELDPSALLARLWQATPFCLSAAERERYLRESSETAAQLQAESRRRATAARPR